MFDARHSVGDFKIMIVGKTDGVEAVGVNDLIYFEQLANAVRAVGRQGAMNQRQILVAQDNAGGQRSRCGEGVVTRAIVFARRTGYPARKVNICRRCQLATRIFEICCVHGPDARTAVGLIHTQPHTAGQCKLAIGGRDTRRADGCAGHFWIIQVDDVSVRASVFESDFQPHRFIRRATHRQARHGNNIANAGIEWLDDTHKQIR